jgi:restriction system protein
MAEITRRRTGELLRALFAILLGAPEGVLAKDALARLSEAITLTDYENGTYDSGTRRLDKIVRFATIDCVKAGWLLKHKGHWLVSEAGERAYKDLPDPEAFYREAVRLYAAWRKSSPAPVSEDAVSTAAEEPEKSASIMFEQAEEQAWGEIEAFLGARTLMTFRI